ncbi:hypothetical protein DPEC_G00182260 [Dallia pectoralis]|uniref:Uncharacterized protein n=1 Tax=Dallia pectoralis TaxID=75939 RepID=A0ACC2GAT6_DALPE|nr:hypothetical protein DPEC_G00182260 [Dallia pectoralis]
MWWSNTVTCMMRKMFRNRVSRKRLSTRAHRTAPLTPDLEHQAGDPENQRDPKGSRVRVLGPGALRGPALGARKVPVLPGSCGPLATIISSGSSHRAWLMHLSKASNYLVITLPRLAARQPIRAGSL